MEPVCSSGLAESVVNIAHIGKVNEGKSPLHTHNAPTSSGTRRTLISLCDELICVWNVKLHKRVAAAHE